jgi:hypothetical protein
MLAEAGHARKPLSPNGMEQVCWGLDQRSYTVDVRPLWAMQQNPKQSFPLGQFFIFQ